MFKKTDSEEMYFLKTGNYLLPFRGYFKNKKKLKVRLHEILDQSIEQLVLEWEKSHGKKWEKAPTDIISNEDLCHSVHIMRLNKKPEKFFYSYFVVT